MIKIQNVYYMLAYAYRFFKEDGKSTMDAEKFENIEELCAAILQQGVAKQLKRGIAKDYLLKSESLSSPKGKIDVSTSLKQMTMLRSELVCEIDEFTENILLNRILKSTMIYLARSGRVRAGTKKGIKKLLFYFTNIDTIDLKSVKWEQIRFYRHTITYRMPISICHFIVSGLIQSSQKGSKKIMHFSDDQAMHALFEGFVRAYYRKHYSELNPSASHIAWDLDNEFSDLLPRMKSDITLSDGERSLIIDTKYYQQNMQHNRFNGNTTIHSSNLYQLFTYVKNKDNTQSGNVAGLLLYAQTNATVQPNQSYVMQGNEIHVQSLNLNTNFPEIQRHLDRIAQEFSKARD